MTRKIQNKFRNGSIRLKGFDYGSNGYYFVTICTKNQKKYFGDNVVGGHHGACLQASQIGKIATDYWMEIPKHHPFVELDEFVIMPNHVHGIIQICKKEKRIWTPNKFGPQSQNLADVIRAYKSSVKRFANQNNIEFEWQPLYYDRIIRNEEGLKAVRQYVQKNPLNDILKKQSNPF